MELNVKNTNSDDDWVDGGVSALGKKDVVIPGAHAFY